MKSYLTLSWKELKSQKITSALILIAIILSTIATTAIGQSIGILQSMRMEQASHLNGNRYATFHELTAEQTQVLSSDSRLTDVGSIVNVGNTRLGNSSLTLYLREYNKNALDIYSLTDKVKKGQLPKKENEIALSEDALQYLNFNGTIGDTITLYLQINRLVDTQPPYEYTADFILTGILENNYIGYVTGIVDAIAGNGTAAALLPERYLLYSTAFKTKNTDQFQNIIYDLAEKLKIEDNFIQYNWILLDALGIDYDEKESSDIGSGFPFMATACILVGGLILLAAGLVIYNILKVTITKRIQEYGTLRAIGSERKQLYCLVSVQLLILCGIGIPFGMLLGMLSAKGILIAATGLLNPDLFMADSTQELNSIIAENSTGKIYPLIVSMIITLLFAMIAAFPAARYASHVSPTVAMNGQTVNIKRNNRRQKKIHSFEAFYARLNLKRNQGRTIITILSIVMSITVFIALQSFSGLLDTSRTVQKMHLGDYAVTNETVGLTPDAVNRLQNYEMVKSLSTTKLSVYSKDKDGNFPVQTDFSLQSWETLQITGLNQTRLSALVPNLTKQDLEDLQNGTACFVKNPIPFSLEGQTIEHTNFQVGNLISVNGISLRIVGIANNPITINNDGFINGVQIIVSDLTFDILTGQNSYSEIYPVLQQNADTEKFEEWLNQWCEKNPGTHWLSYRQSDAQLEESFEQINLLCWCLILFISLIGVLNIINTVYTNIHTRVNEIGMQRAIGMSKYGLYKTFLWEGVYYGLIASVIGAILGYICTILISAAESDTLQLTAIPIVSILEASFVSIACCLIATAIPLRTIAKMNIVTSIVMIE